MAPRDDSHWRALAALLAPHRRSLALMGAVLAGASSLSLLGPLLIRAFVDRALAGEGSARLIPLAVAYVVLALVAELVGLAVVWGSTRLVWRVTDSVRTELTAHILGLDLEFHRANAPGGLVERVDGDLTAVADYLANFAVRALSAVLTVIGVLIVLTVIDVRLAVVLALYVVIAGASMVRVRSGAVSEAEEERGAYAQLYGGIEERLVGRDDLRANGAADYAIARFGHDAVAVLGAATVRERATMWLWHVVSGAVAGGAVVALAAGAYAYRSDWISLGTAFLLFQYTQVIRTPLEATVEQLQEVQRAAGGIRRVGELLDTEPRHTFAGTATLPEGALAVRLDRVTFTYQARGHPVVSDFELDLEAGRHLGLVGRTGSGKTTIGRLVSRLVVPTAGSITIGGVPLSEVSEVELRRRVGVVPQEVHLFGSSLRDNVTLFDRSVPDERVVEVLERVGLAERLLGRGGGLAHELIGDGGGFSAGEGQLLALSRVLLRDPDLVILDEATARVDPDTEARLIEAIADVLVGRTAIVIAHRMATIERLDEIVVLESGRVIESGRREDLLADGGVYSRLRSLAQEAPV